LHKTAQNLARNGLTADDLAKDHRNSVGCADFVFPDRRMAPPPAPTDAHASPKHAVRPERWCGIL
jgi:hypothetical protein